MSNPAKQRTPRPGGALDQSIPNHYEQEKTMNSVQSTTDTDNFASCTVQVGTSRPIYINLATRPDGQVVRFDIDADTAFTLEPHVAIAYGALTQAVGLHAIEEQPMPESSSPAPAADHYEPVTRPCVDNLCRDTAHRWDLANEPFMLDVHTHIEQRTEHYVAAAVRHDGSAEWIAEYWSDADLAGGAGLDVVREYLAAATHMVEVAGRLNAEPATQEVK